MITITKVEVQKRNTDRVNVYVDDEFYTGMALDVCVKYGIKAGTTIDEEQLQQIVLDSDKTLALNKVANYMQSALKTTKQIRDYLRKKGYNKQVEDYVIDKLKEYKYLDDTAYAKTYVEVYGRKCGKMKLVKQLSDKGVARDIIDSVLSDWEADPDVVLAVARKKLDNKPATYDNLSKVMNFLASRGYNYDEIKSAINVLKENKDESWD